MDSISAMPFRQAMVMLQEEYNDKMRQTQQDSKQTLPIPISKSRKAILAVSEIPSRGIRNVSHSGSRSGDQVVP